MKFFKIIWSIIVDLCCAFGCFIENNLRNFARMLNLILPYLMYIVGQYVCTEREKITFGGEIFIPICFCMIIYFIRSYANKIGKGITIPVPEKRFTEVDEYGEVSIENNRVQELILYLADLEDWLERKGML